MSAISNAVLRLALAAALAALAACAGTPTHFYTLLKPSGEQPVAVGAGFAIDVQDVRVPPQVDQPALVVRQGTGEVALVETRQWVAPLKDEVRGALSAELRQRLGVQDVAGVGTPPDMPVYRVRVDLQRLDGWLAHGVSVEAAWTVSVVGSAALDDKRAWTCASRVDEAIAAGYEPFVVGTQHALAKLAADIASLIDAARRAPAGADVRCPAAA